MRNLPSNGQRKLNCLFCYKVNALQWTSVCNFHMFFWIMFSITRVRVNHNSFHKYVTVVRQNCVALEIFHYYKVGNGTRKMIASWTFDWGIHFFHFWQIHLLPCLHDCWITCYYSWEKSSSFVSCVAFCGKMGENKSFRGYFSSRHYTLWRVWFWTSLNSK